MSKGKFLRHPNRQNRIRPQRRRQYLFELLEGRHMLSTMGWVSQTEEIPGELPDFLTTADRMAMSPALTADLAESTVRAVDASFNYYSDLSHYTVEEMTAAESWIVRTFDTLSENGLASQLGSTFAEAFLPIENTYVVSSSVAAGDVCLNDWLIQLGNNSNVRNFYPSVPSEKILDYFPNDPYFEYQWHLVSTGQEIGNPDHFPVYAQWGEDINVFPVWDSYTGDGIQIGIIDTGLQYTHPDLVAHYNGLLDYDYIGNDPNPAPGNMLTDLHGTCVAGVAAGVGNNGIGIAGVAYDADIIGIRAIGGYVEPEDFYDVLRHKDEIIDVYNNSWGYNQSGGVIAASPFETQAIQDAHFFGRNGLGNIYIWSAGNAGLGGGSCDWDSNKSDRYTISVGAVTEEGFQAIYSSYGASLLTSAYSGSAYGFSSIPVYGSGIWTTDLIGDNYGYNMEGSDEDPINADPFSRDYFPDTNYTSRFSGTSSAAPVVAGVVALMLEANPNLTYRDVEHILVRSADMTGFNQYVGQPDNIIFEFEPYFYENSAGNTFSYGLGHGIVDAKVAVALAENWTPVADEIHRFDPDTIHGASYWIFPGVSGQIVACTDNFCPMNLGSEGDENPGAPFITYEMPDDMVVEWLEVTTIWDDAPDDSANFEIYATSPDGTVDLLTAGGAWASSTGALEWTFKTNNFWGERLGGEWIFDFLNFSRASGAHLQALRLDWYGTEAEGSARVQGDIAFDLNGNMLIDTEANPFGDQIPIEPQAAEMIIYVDMNENGLRESFEPFFMTGNDGNWYFDLDPGDYIVRVEVPPTMLVTDGEAVINVSLDEGDRMQLDSLLLDPNPIMITGNVFIDNDGNGYNNGEPPATNFTVFADINKDGVPSTGDVFTTTDFLGNYTLFVDEGTGVYAIFVIPQNNLEVTTPEMGFHMLYIDAGETVSNLTFGVGIPSTNGEPPVPSYATVTGYVFNDMDEDGIRDAGEPGLNNWIVFLDLDNDGLVGLGEPSMRTNSLGAYTFTNLVSNFYRVRAVNQPGWDQTVPGGDGSYLFQVFPNQTIQNVNFGYSNQLTSDWGDLLGYPTLASENGPNHKIQPFFYMGSGVDGEVNGQPDANAMGDDMTGLADEDGIGVLDPITANTTVRITATANTPGGYLQGWMDYNRDGDWDDVGERVFTNVLLDPGVNHLTIDIPGYVTVGPVYARFRYGEYGIDSYTGPALGGEVEDYVFNAIKTAPVVFDDADFNHDHAVNGSDLTEWVDGFGTTTGATHANGDADGDGDVDGNDFLLWQLGLGGGGAAADAGSGGNSGVEEVPGSDETLAADEGIADDLALPVSTPESSAIRFDLAIRELDANSTVPLSSQAEILAPIPVHGLIQDLVPAAMESSARDVAVGEVAATRFKDRTSKRDGMVHLPLTDRLPIDLDIAIETIALDKGLAVRA
ncbi:MAG: S8 family serine peptidase [Pirellulales bacterium]|nr:S8 family serine peptidase [Pirellulales bacterium]